MHYPLSFATAVSTALTTAGVTTCAVQPMGDTTEVVTPILGVMVQGFSSVHPAMHRGSLVLRYEFDVDSTTSTGAAAELQAALDYLLSATGRGALAALLAVDGIWLRILGPAGATGEVTVTGDRERTMDASLPFWIQTAL